MGNHCWVEKQLHYSDIRSVSWELEVKADRFSSCTTTRSDEQMDAELMSQIGTQLTAWAELQHLERQRFYGTRSE